MGKKMWGGRFAGNTDPAAENFARSIQYDYKLAKYDILGSIAHVAILGRAGYLTAKEVIRMQSALIAIGNGKFMPDDSYEDVHSQIQDMLGSKVGSLALKLHTARSRNDQVVFSTKVYCKVQLAQLEKSLSGVIDSLNGLAKANKDLIIPGFTHMQHAQPIYLKDYIGAYVMMLQDDAAKVKDAFSGIELSMGAGAVAGTPIAARHYRLNLDGYARKLGIGLRGLRLEPTRNPVYTVSERGFVAESLNVTAIIATHLSRFAEDMIMWSTKEFGFVDIEESFCTGSSLMPHKKNPDVLELVRGCAGRLYGNRIGFLAVIKGLPLSYNRDMQLDKQPLFDSFEMAIDELQVLKGLVKTIKFNISKIEEHLEDESLYATDLVYYLVEKGVAFKTAHTIVGRLIRFSLDNSVEIKSMTDRELKRHSEKFNREDILRLFNPKVSVESKKSIKR